MLLALVLISFICVDDGIFILAKSIFWTNLAVYITILTPIININNLQKNSCSSFENCNDNCNQNFSMLLNNLELTSKMFILWVVLSLFLLEMVESFIMKKRGMQFETVNEEK